LRKNEEVAIMKIYATRYQAEQAKYGDAVCVKVCAGGDKVGYVLMRPDEYKIWRRQK
jgi:hypothetical protein